MDFGVNAKQGILVRGVDVPTHREKLDRNSIK